MNTGSQSGTARWSKVALIAGFLALVGGLYAAITSPATGYELSIYAATPLAFWEGVGFALLTGLVVAWFADTQFVRSVGCLLGGGAVSAVVGLPLLRGYYFFGHADAMTHLGWVRDLASGGIDPTDLLYPGIHTFAVFVGEITGYPLSRSLMLVVFLLGLVFLVLFPLGARRLLDRGRLVTLAAFSGFLLLPINLISTHMQAHTFTQTLLLSALVLLVLFIYLRHESTLQTGTGRSVGALLALSTAAVVFYHPQQAVNLLIVFLAIAAYQFVGGRLGWDQPFRTVYAQTAWFGAVLGGWLALRFGAIERPTQNLVSGLAGYLSGSPPTAGESVSSQSQSLTAIGSGLLEIYLKLFLVHTVFIALAGILALSVLLNRTDRGFPDRLTKYLVFGLVVLTPLPVVYFLANVSEHYFRHFGFIMLVVSFLGVLALSEGERWSVRSAGKRLGGLYTVGVPIAFAVMLTLSLATVFASPYIYKANRHVTQSEMTGHQMAFEHVEDDGEIAGLRSKVYRYADGVYGTEATPDNRRSVSAQNMTSLSAYFDGRGYLVTSEYGERRETEAYQGLRFSREDFDSLGAQPGVDRVLSNRETTLYHVG